MTGVMTVIGSQATIVGFLGQMAVSDYGVLGASPAGGFYVTLLKIAGMVVLMVPWIYIAPWVAKDSKHVRAPEGLWGSVVLGAGTGAFLVWLLLPTYAVGLILYVVTISSVVISYLAYRNGRVEEDQKITLMALLKRRQHGPQVSAITKLKLYGVNNQVVLPPNEESADPEAVTAYNLAQSLLYDIVWNRASEVDLAPSGQQTRMRFVIDGVISDRAPIPLAESETIIQYLKTVANLNADERRRPQKGQLTVDLDGKSIEIALTTAGKTTGQRMHFRVVHEFVQTNLDELGITSEMLARLRELNQSDNGIIIVSGRPGSGVTSTLYSLLRQHDVFIQQLMTLEAKVDVDLENISQREYEDQSKFPDILASTLRRDPDVIMVDSCLDTQSAVRLCQTAQDKLVIVGMQASDSFTALAKWVKLCGNQTTAVASMHACICQMLLRKLCHQCREPYKPDPQLLAKVNIPSERIEAFYRPSGKHVNEKGKSFPCHACQGTGYFGRTAVFELLEVNEELKQRIVKGASLSQIKATARKNRMLYLQEQALRKVIAGETSIQEVIRVSQTKK